ncbi:hypothetical protein [Staphylococcus pseudintermedius]|uniref:hypothetical protein n=1 Tax=Staphylococcus pseudintermedius TaxID=283734 RepID=UPI0019DE968C|nr:hypothetical protein [Staphylococcus pseudintermedius]EGQ3505533.1 hypothetical protein [Staphylococcus pseudintermedius]EGQ4324923.1 hypothetical protein [Staphylococcus pseudintermedius]EJG0126008.1 hypothetical protein [Staphylococcus pseudintermedius]EJG1249241.1 hypothetical protein [Staphylococcus pseudintermedius]EJG5108259.1 hypothetical protein [Staphylococcus pseudintermedius]
MKKRHMMKSAHKIAKEIVFLVGDYMIALKLALKEVWRLVKTYNKKRFTEISIFTTAARLGTKKPENKGRFVGGVPEWIINKNLTTEEAYAVLNNGPQVSVTRETEKAVLVDFHTDFGHITMWCPKSVMAA